MGESEQPEEALEPARERARLHVFDGSPIELRGRRSQLRMAGLERSWEITGHSSRNALLEELGREATQPRRQSVVLIDARVESGDIDQIGFRICETIKRHDRLWRATRPLIWVDRLSEGNCLHAQRSGATAILDDDWVDRTDAAGLGEKLAQELSQAPRPYGQGGRSSFRILSDQSVDPETEVAERDKLFERRFGRRPKELDFVLLWGMADAVELSFLWWYCAEEGIASSHNQAKKGCERLQAAMRPDREHLDRPEPTNAEIARRFLAEVAPAAPDPLAEIAWPSVEYVQQTYFEPRLRSLAFLEPGSERLLESFFASYEPSGPSARERYDAIIGACAVAAANGGVAEGAARRQIQRSLHALDDARLDDLAPAAGNDPSH